MARKQNSKNDIILSGGAAPSPIRRKAARNLRPVAPEETSEVSAPTQVQPLPAYEEIAKLAYSYWEARGCQGGSPEEDWLRAEDELRTRAATVGAIA